MARIRSIHPDALKSEKLAASSAEAERCYWRLSTHCDDAGICEDDPQILAAFLFPRSDKITGKVVDGWLGELHAVGLIVRYKTDSGAFLYITRWADYQRPNRPTPSKYPPPPEPLPEHSLSHPGALPLGVGEGVGEGEGDSNNGAHAPSRPRGTRIPIPFHVSEPMQEWAAREIAGFDWHRETPNFVDYWRAKPGAGGVKLDWDATWRTWMRRSANGGFQR